MPLKITVKGRASEKVLLEESLTSKDNINLMEYLRAKNIPIASACFGDGVCQKCKITLNQNTVLSCQLMLSDLTNNDILIEVDYL